MTRFLEIKISILFACVFFILAAVSALTPIADSMFVSPPAYLTAPIFIALLLGITLYPWLAIKNQSPHPLVEVFLMAAAVCAPLSDGFWIFLTLTSISIIAAALKKGRLYYKDTILAAFAVLFIVALVSSFFALESKFLAFGTVLGIALYGLFFLAVYNAFPLLKERWPVLLPRLGVLMASSITVTVLFSLWHFFFESRSIQVLIFSFPKNTGLGNSFGIASVYGQWPTHSSAFLGLAFWALLILRPFAQDKIQKIVITIGAISSLVGLFATLSRNAALFILIGLGLMLILTLVKKEYRGYLPWALGGLFLSALVLFQFLMRFDKWRTLLSNPWESGTFLNRIQQYRFAWDQLTQGAVNLWTGIGLMNFGPYARRIFDPNMPDYLHQIFLSLLLEMGVLGIAAFLVLMYVIGKRLIFSPNKNKNLFLLVFFSWLATGIFDNWLYFMWSSSLFMVILAAGSIPKEVSHG